MADTPRLDELRLIACKTEDFARVAGEECLEAFPLGEGWRVETQEHPDKEGWYFWWLSHTSPDLSWEVSIQEHELTGELYHVASMTYHDHGADYVSDLGPWEAVAGLYKECQEAADEFIKQATPGATGAVMRVVESVRAVAGDAAAAKRLRDLSRWDLLKEECENE